MLNYPLQQLVSHLGIAENVQKGLMQHFASSRNLFIHSECLIDSTLFSVWIIQIVLYTNSEVQEIFDPVLILIANLIFFNGASLEKKLYLTESPINFDPYKPFLQSDRSIQGQTVLLFSKYTPSVVILFAAELRANGTSSLQGETVQIIRAHRCHNELTTANILHGTPGVSAVIAAKPGSLDGAANHRIPYPRANFIALPLN